ncbi:MAG: polysaccharide deacetylase family protein [Phycisphaeraceae bacterium]
MSDELLFNLFVDCEATQPAVDDAELGRRAVTGIVEVLEANDLRGTFHVIPGDAEAMPELYRDLHERGHEIGLHVHPAAQGYGEFLGVYGPDDQRKIIGEAKDRLEQAVGFAVHTFCPGYGSMNDFTYSVLVELGFRHGICTLPTRILPECASVHAGAPLGIHYAHPFNRVLSGDLDFVEIPPTVDPDSRMWGGKHPQDLRIELVDAKNHWYTMHKAVQRQLAERAAVPYLRAITHNTFDYADPRDFRRLTLTGVIERARSIAAQTDMKLTGATAEQIANRYRAAVPRTAEGSTLTLDRRGYTTTT